MSMQDFTRPPEFLRAVSAFLVAAGDPVGAPDARAVARYIGMQFEELSEKMHALGLTTLANSLDASGALFKEGANDEHVAVALSDPARSESLLDADVDLAWVSLASSFTAGADVRGACGAVGISNMSKIGADGTVERDANGKIQKPAWFIPVDLSPYTWHALATTEGAEP